MCNFFFSLNGTEANYLSRYFLTETFLLISTHDAYRISILKVEENAKLQMTVLRQMFVLNGVGVNGKFMNIFSRLSTYFSF